MIIAHFVLIDAGNVASINHKLNSGQESTSSPINRVQVNKMRELIKTTLSYL